MHEDQREFYSCPLCGAGTGNDIDNAIHGSPEHDCPVEKEMRAEHEKGNKIELRKYQREAIDKIKWSLKEKLEGGDLVVLPTGAGKSIVIAKLAEELDQDILILQPSKEILEQNAGKLAQYVGKEEICIYSASFGPKEIKKYTFATVQSIYTKPEEFAHFKLVLIDEAHNLNPKRGSSMFTSLLKEMGDPKVIGFTATPYRIMTGYRKENTGWGGYNIVAYPTLKLVNRIQPRFWHRIIFNINNHELVEQDYLVPLHYLDSSLLDHESIPLNKSKTEFDWDAVDKEVSRHKLTIVEGVKEALRTHKSVLVFCTSVRQSQDLEDELCILMGNPNIARSVSSATKAKDRDSIISGFKNGSIRVVFNVGVLTTGFDHPALDCIVLARPTRSLALYYQMLGRGVRKAEGKTQCTVIDFTSTVKTMGRVESIKIVKEDGKWVIRTATGQWHDRPLFSYVVKEVLPTEPQPEVPEQQEPVQSNLLEI